MSEANPRSKYRFGWIPIAGVASCLVASYLVLRSQSGLYWNLPFLSKYKVLPEGNVLAADFEPRQLYWVHGSYEQLTTDFSKITMEGYSSGSRAVPVVRVPAGSASYWMGRSGQTGEAWIIRPGKVSYPDWPNPETTNPIPGSAKDWCTLMYAPGSGHSIIEQIERHLTHY